LFFFVVSCFVLFKTEKAQTCRKQKTENKQEKTNKQNN